MAKSKNPFLNFDIEKALASFEAFGIDLGAMMTAQRKNLEALTLANQLASEAIQTVGRRHAQLAQEAAEEASALMEGLGQPGAPDQMMAKHAELAKTAFDKGMAQSREFGEILSQAHMAAFNVLTKRMVESFEELQAAAAAAAKPKPGR